MNFKKILPIISFIVLGFLISACGSAYQSTGWHGLASDTDNAYLAAGTQVFSVDISSGSENWRYPDKANAKIAFYTNPVLTADGQLLVPSYDTNLYSLNPTTGSQNWLFEDSSNKLIGSPLVMGEMIYQPSSDNYLYALDMNGRLVWSQETGGPLWAQPTTLEGCDCIIVTSMDHTVYSFNANTGSQLWQTEELGGALVGTPAVSADGVIYVGTFASEMIAMDADDGRIIWRFATDDWVWAGPALADGTLYFGDLSGYFYALNAAEGTLKWRIQPQNSIVSTPAVVEDKIYLTTEGDTLFIVSTSGDVLDTTVIGGMIYSAPLITGDTVLVSPTGFESLLVALNLEGNQKWTFAPAKK